MGSFDRHDLLETLGDFGKFLGVVQKRYGEKKEEVERWVRDWYERDKTVSRKATASRNDN